VISMVKPEHASWPCWSSRERDVRGAGSGSIFGRRANRDWARSRRVLGAALPNPLSSSARKAMDAESKERGRDYLAADIFLTAARFGGDAAINRLPEETLRRARRFWSRNRSALSQSERRQGRRRPSTRSLWAGAADGVGRPPSAGSDRAGSSQRSPRPSRVRQGLP
jgi:hypothetical protein